MMYVIYNEQTGEEIDREEHYEDAIDIIRNFNNNVDGRNPFEYTATYRREA